MSEAPSRRFLIRYAIQRWDDGKWFYGSLFIVVIALGAFNLASRRSILSLVPVFILDGFILALLFLARRYSYLEAGPDALRIRYLIRHVELPYTALSKVRRQPLEVAFQPAERRRWVNRFVRKLAHEPAVYIRIDRRQPEVLAAAERTLGQRFVAGPDIVLPIVDTDAFIAEMKGRLRGPAS